MNWLAHLFLSGPDLEFRLGNLLADLVKGRELQAMPPAFRRGARCHLTIDGFTDFHPVVVRSRGRIAARHGHYSGILMDVFYDHFLARNWERFAGGGTLDDWTRELHAAIREHPLVLPGDAALAIEHMVETDRLRSYRELAGVADALGRLSRRLAVRLRRPVALERAVEDLAAHHAELEADFLEFFPALREHVAAWRDGEGKDEG